MSLSKIKTALWFIRHPKFYPQFFQLVKSRIYPVDEKRDEAMKWCSQKAISAEEAYEMITGKMLPFKLSQNFRDEFEEAEKKIIQLPTDRGGPGDIDLLYHLCESIAALKVIETGVAYGWSSLAILLSLQSRKNSRLVSTDMPYAKMQDKDYVGCVVPEGMKNSWELIRLPDRQGLPKAVSLLNNEIDLCHYDSDKSYEGRMWAYPKLWQALRKSGIFISDDIGDNFAFRDFSLKMNKEPIIIKSTADPNTEKYVGIIVK